MAAMPIAKTIITHTLPIQPQWEYTMPLEAAPTDHRNNKRRDTIRAASPAMQRSNAKLRARA
jgi:hypothetical protein